MNFKLKAGLIILLSLIFFNRCTEENDSPPSNNLNPDYTLNVTGCNEIKYNNQLYQIDQCQEGYKIFAINPDTNFRVKIFCDECCIDSVILMTNDTITSFQIIQEGIIHSIEGSWNVNESCTKDQYTVKIIPDLDSCGHLIIQNFWIIGNKEKSPYAIIHNDSIFIPEQAITNNNFISVKGAGKINSNNELNFTYEVNNGADLWHCNANFIKEK